MLDILCLGEPMVEFNRQPDGRWLQGFGGDVSNVAVAAARQGARAGMATRIGTDGFGDDLMKLWRDEGIDTAHVERDPNAPTGLYFVRHGADGHAFEYRRAGSAASRMTPSLLPSEALATRCLHLSGISQAIGGCARETCDAAVGTARAQGVLVSYDPNLRLSLWSLPEAREAADSMAAASDVFLPGLEDARQLTGLERPGEIADRYFGLGARLVALTLGAEGVLVAEPSGNTLIPAPKVRLVDAGGAGDCFDGAFLARLLAGDDAVEAARYAVMAAAISVEGYGAVAPIPTRAEVEARRAALTPRPPTR